MPRRVGAFDAIVLTGGRSSRLGSVAKAGLFYRRQTLLQRSLVAVRAARAIVVVGPEDSSELSSRILTAREEPAYGGPAAGIAAGLTTIRSASPIPAGATVVIACDMPHVGRAVPALITAFFRAQDFDGVIALDDEGRRQPLAACYRTDALASAIARADRAGGLDSLSVSRLLESLALEELPVPGRWTADVDTWEDAERLGIRRAPTNHETSEERR